MLDLLRLDLGKMILRIVSTWYDIRSEYSESHPMIFKGLYTIMMFLMTHDARDSFFVQIFQWMHFPGLEYILVSRADTRLLCSLALHGLLWMARSFVMRSSVWMVKLCNRFNESQNWRICHFFKFCRDFFGIWKLCIRLLKPWELVCSNYVVCSMYW